MNEFTDGYWQSGDGLKLHYRDYAGRADRPPVLCLHGLTRNGRDFEGLAARLAGEWRVICPDMRGRGDSAWSKNSQTYNPMQYVADIGALCEELKITRFVAIGTSMGGLMTMLMAQFNPAQIAGAVINDIGPVIDLSGLERIGDYVGQPRSFPTWMQAARALEAAQGAMFPRLTIADWLVLAKRSMVLGGNGRIVFDYDMKIAESGNVAIKMTLTAPACPVAGSMPKEVADRVSLVEGVGEVEVTMTWDPPWTQANMSEVAKVALDMF